MDEGESLHNIGKILLDSALTKAPAHCTLRKAQILQIYMSQTQCFEVNFAEIT